MLDDGDYEITRSAGSLIGELNGLFSARRGDYRIIYSVRVVASVVIMHRIQHRRFAYRRARPLGQTGARRQCERCPSLVPSRRHSAR